MSFPIRRVLIPLLPPFLLSNIIIFENYKEFKYKSLFAYVLSFVLLTNMFLNLEINSTIDWGKSYDQNTLSCLENPTEAFSLGPRNIIDLLIVRN